jgi:hypothetical protein
VPPLGRDHDIELFAQRAQAARPTCAFDAASWWRVAGVVRRLDGLPLAIEPDFVAASSGDLTSKKSAPRSHATRVISTVTWRALLGAPV